MAGQLNQQAAKGVCPICGEDADGDFGLHLRQAHGEATFRESILAAKKRGMSDREIGSLYGISFNALEQIVTEAYGLNVSVLDRPKRIKSWSPRNFSAETTTVWSFRQRGNWATHDGRYRGNWSPYIPRNVILKYSQPGELVLDYFAGGGTTAVEAKLLGRRCIARDLNPEAVGLMRENLNFHPPQESRFGFGESSLFSVEHPLPTHEPEVFVGDARDLSDIPDESIDLICAHPPYAGIIKYSTNVVGDLSALTVEDFLVSMSQVAKESHRVLKPGRQCAILIGDARKDKHVVPIGFQTIRVFLDAGFKLRELVIKRQHNCKTTGFWYTNSIKHNFLLLAHEYLPIFEKPTSPGQIREVQPLWEYALPGSQRVTSVEPVRQGQVETTTVWVLPEKDFESELKRNLLARFAQAGSRFLEISLGAGEHAHPDDLDSDAASLVYFPPPVGLEDRKRIAAYTAAVSQIASSVLKKAAPGGFLVIDTRDLRLGQALYPLGLEVWEILTGEERLALKEIVILLPEGKTARKPGETEHALLEIMHRYLLVYRIKHP